MSPLVFTKAFASSIFLLACSVSTEAQTNPPSQNPGKPDSLLDLIKLPVVSSPILDRIEQQLRGKNQHAILGKPLDFAIDRTISPLRSSFHNYDVIRYDATFDPIFLTEDWAGPNAEEVKVALAPTYELLREVFKIDGLDAKIHIFRGEPHPRIHVSGRGHDKVHVIRLSTEGYFYPQYTYQWAHELTHLFTNHEDLQNERFLWMLEMFAEMGSAYAIFEFSRDSPISQFDERIWQSYFNANYEKNYGSRLDHLLEPDSKVEDWYPEYKDLLEHFGTVRELNWAFAHELLPHFIVDKDLWSQLAEMNKWDNSRDDNMQDYLNSWRKRLEKRGKGTTLIDLLESKMPHGSRR